MNKFNKKEYNDICKKYDGEKVVKNINIELSTKDYFDRFYNNVKKDRRGEVVFAVFKDDKVVVIRSKEYPENVYRIPTGGINYGEDIEKAVIREVKEELGVKTKITKFIGVVKFTFIHKDKSFNFYSYLFFLQYLSGQFLVDAIEDEVCDYKLVSKKNLNGISHYLLTLDDFWNDWGKFRFETSNFVFENMKNNNI